MLQRPHVVQPVRHLDQDHAHVAHHGQQHLAHVLGLAVFAVGELDLVDLGHALDDVRDLLPELLGDVFGSNRGIFDGIVQQAGRDRGRVQLHLRQNLGYLEGMQDIRLPGGPELPAVVLYAELPGSANDADVVARPILADGREQLGELRRQDSWLCRRFDVAWSAQSPYLIIGWPL